MKKYFTFGLILSLVSVACFAENPRIAQLIQEKQQKMEKLEKCKGTTKNLKIAGISTLGITAVGIGANIAEAVVLSNTKDDVKKAQAARDAQLEIKGNRQEFEQFCNEIGGDLVYSGSGCVKYATDIDEYNSLVSMMRQKFSNCQATANPLQERCVDKDKRGVSIILREQNDQNKGSGQGDKEQDSGQDGKEQPVDPGDVYKYKQENYTCTQKVKAVFDEVYDAVEKCKKQNNIVDDDTMNIVYIMGTMNQYEEILDAKKIRRVYTLPNLYCDAGFSIDKDMGECEPDAEQGKPKTLEQKCKERHPNGSSERLACCYAGGATRWDDKTNTCSCKESNQEWKGGKCIPKPDNGNKGGKGGQDGGNGGRGGANSDEECLAPTYKYDGRCFTDDKILTDYCDGHSKAARSYAAGRSICSINLSDERYATKEDGINRAQQWATHIPQMTDCKTTVNWVGDDMVYCTVGPVAFQFTFDALNADDAKTK